MKAGDIVFVRGKSFISDVIRFFDKGEFTHVAIAVTPDTVIEAQRFTRVNMVPFTDTDYEIIDLHLLDAQRKLILTEAAKLVGKRYDYIQILRYVLKDLFHINTPNSWNNPNTLVCSEMISRVLYKAGLIENSKDLFELTPNQLYSVLSKLAESRRPS